MFKNMIFYRISETWQPDLVALDTALAKQQFEQCGATQEKSTGWVPPRGEEHGALLESIGGHWILRFKTESKSVPGSVLARKVEEKAVAIEQETGRKPGKKERREIKDEVKLSLLPYAFTKQSATWVWIDPSKNLLMIDAASQKRADDVVSTLIESWVGLSVALVDTAESPQSCMAHWLKEQEAPEGFTIDRTCELKAVDESRAVVKYGSHPLDIDEIREHIDQGKLPTKLAMTWDDRISFVLTDGLYVRKLCFLDSVFEGRKHDDSGFDADVAIATGELAKLLPELIDAMGGEG